MAEFIQTLLGLSREDKLKIISLLAENLQSGESPLIPNWQQGFADNLLADFDQSPDDLIAEEAYWAKVYAHRLARKRHPDAETCFFKKSFR